MKLGRLAGARLWWAWEMLESFDCVLKVMRSH